MRHPPATADDLSRLVKDARRRTLELVDDLADEHLTVPKMEVVNPFLWELGHVAFFYDVFLLRVLGSEAFLLDGAERLYDSFRVDHDDRWELPLPSRRETLSYMGRVTESVLGRLNGREPDAREAYLYRLSVLHEDMHAEAFTYMRQTLNYPAPRTGAAEIEGGALPGDAEVPGGTVLLGATPDSPFVWDNEKWAHPVHLKPFKIARAAVTNAQFAEFVEDRGYLRREFWTPAGWVWRTKIGALQPVYWQRGERGWLERSFDRMVPLREHAPVVHVTWHEADAYCRWANRRLPTEAEWTAAAAGIADPDSANLDSRLPGVADVGAFPAGDSAVGCRQMIGNVWEWTASDFYPFPGFTPDQPYEQYSAPWFGYRKVLKGGAWATRSRLANTTYRNFFQPYRRDIIAGFRTCAV